MVKKNLFTILVALLIMYLSLANSATFEKVSFFKFPMQDKIVHFGMYFGLMSVIIFENKKNLKTTLQLFLIAIIPLFYGILMEILTVSRSGSIYDVIFNLAGILVSLLLWLWIKATTKESIR
jgi:VanZ family protein